MLIGQKNFVVKFLSLISGAKIHENTTELNETLAYSYTPSSENDSLAYSIIRNES